MVIPASGSCRAPIISLQQNTETGRLSLAVWVFLREGRGWRWSEQKHVHVYADTSASTLTLEKKEKNLITNNHMGNEQVLLRKWQFIYLFIEGLKPSQPHRVTPGLFTNSNLTQVEYNTKHAHFTFTNIKHINIIRKLVPFVLLICCHKKMANKVRRCWYQYH